MSAEPSALLDAAQLSIEAGRLVAGRALLAAAGAAGAAADPCDELDGRLTLDEGRHVDAAALLAAALRRSPENWRLMCLSAEARLAASDPRGAVSDAADAVVTAPTEAAPKAVLGAALATLQRHVEAAACLTEAVAGNRLHIGYRLALAQALASQGDVAAARRVLDQGVVLRPHALGLRIAVIRLAIGLGEHDDAVALADDACDAGVSDACILGLRGHALSCLGRDDEAAAAYLDALRLAPEDGYVRHLAAASGQLPQPPRASADYVRVVFDGFAQHFEADLVRCDYRGPALIRAALLEHADWPHSVVSQPAAPRAPDRLGPVLDLGCGTGLVAAALAGLPLGPLTGIDLSPGMLREAAAKGLYARLVEADIAAGLDQLGRFAVVLAADVLPYLGDPAPVFAAVARCLLPRGLFVLALEALDDDAPAPFHLGPRARYAHRPDALQQAAAAAGLAVRSCRRETLRLDRDVAVPGCLLVLQREPTA